MIKKLIGIVLAILVYLIQTSFGENISVGNISPNLIILLVVSWGFLNGKKSGILIGFLCGFLVDIFYGYNNIFGLNSLLYMYVGYINGWFNEMFYGDDIKLPIALVAFSDFAYNFVIYVLMFLLRNKLDIGFYLNKIILPEVVYTTFLAIFLYKILYKLCKWLNKNENRSEAQSV